MSGNKKTMKQGKKGKSTDTPNSEPQAPAEQEQPTQPEPTDN